ncbi:MAG: lytic murein transglycosylase [bacterium]|nr:lytic murein transglycosylase [bacterium]
MRDRQTSDIKPGLDRRLNISPKKSRFRLFSFLQQPRVASVFLAFFFLFIIGFAQAPGVSILAANDEDNAQRIEERKELEDQLATLEKEMAEYQTTIDEYKKKGNSLKGEIATLETKVKKLNLQIQAVNINITRLNQQIRSTQTQINQTENQIDNKKTSLTTTVRNLYEIDNQSLVEILIANANLSEFFNDLNNIMLVQEKMKVDLNEVMNLRNDLVEQKQELSLQYNDAENLKAYQLLQQQQTKAIQNQKNSLLKETKGQESNYQKLLTKTKESAAQIRNRIFQLLGGGSMTFEQAYQYAKLAEGATGIRASFILAILNQESLFGKNVGQCFYNEKTKYAATAMNPKEIPVFLEMVKKLGIDPNSVLAKVSCPNRDGNYGGAMGPSQFIPSTWKIYEKEVAKITGNNPPSPWNNSDAFAGTAAYLEDSIKSKACVDYGNQIPAQRQLLLERCAAAKYYAGGRWYTYRFTYGEAVATRAEDYQKDIDVITDKNLTLKLPVLVPEI